MRQMMTQHNSIMNCTIKCGSLAEMRFSIICLYIISYDEALTVRKPSNEIESESVAVCRVFISKSNTTSSIFIHQVANSNTLVPVRWHLQFSDILV